MKKLSIITICYNEPNLERTCESIVNQTWQDFEWIVVDGGSNEETQKIWDKYKYRIDKFISEPDDGRYNAMNKGIKIANGEFLNFLNAGDFYFYDNVLKNIFENKEYSSGVLYGFEYIKTNRCDDFIQALPEKITKSFFIETTIRHQASFIRKELFFKYGFYDESMSISADVREWLNLITNNVTFERLPYIVTNFDLEGISSNKKYKKLSFEEKCSTLKKYFSKKEVYTYSKTRESFYLSENIFSIKLSRSKLYIIITILGIHIRIKRWFI